MKIATVQIIPSSVSSGAPPGGAVPGRIIPGSVKSAPRKPRRRIMRTVRRISGLFLLTAALFGLWGIHRAFSVDSRYWPGWYVARFPRGTDAAVLTGLLESFGIFGSLSASSALVLVQEIPRTVEIPAARISQRLQHGDPRLDPFLRSVPQLFESGNSSLIYLPADRSAGAYRRTFRRRPEFSSVEIMDDVSSENWKPLLVFLIAVVLIWVLISEGALDSAPAALPWPVLVGVTGYELLIPALAAYIAAALRHARRGHAPWCFASAALLTGMIGFYTALPVSVMFALAFIISEFAPRLCGAWKVSVRSRGCAGREHALFEPLSLSASTRVSHRPPCREMRVWRLIILALIPASAVLYPKPPNHQPIPALGQVIGPFDSIAALHRLSEVRGPNRLPDLADMVSSAVYQQGFMNGALYQVPLPGTSLIRRDYTQEEDRIIVKDAVITHYSAQWFRAALDSILSRGAGRLYASAGGIAPVRMAERPSSRVLNRRIDAAAGLIIAAALIFAFLPRFLPPRWAISVYRNDLFSSRLLKKVRAA